MKEQRIARKDTRQDLICFNKYGGGSYNWAWKGNIANGTLELI
jgi:hypothetical protein